ncbi:MAG: c-type cytochrome [Pirellulales bacterium]|nr:c-type cytochrome [Pirellulales bacterium]
MPATEQTWYNQKTLHVVFGASALLMAAATVLLMANDHNREWKDWQLKDRKKDAWTVQSRRDALADQYSTRMAGYEEEIRGLDSQAFPPALVDRFKQLVRQEDARLKAKEESPTPPPAEQTPAVRPVSYQQGDSASETADEDSGQFATLDKRVQALSQAAAAATEVQSEIERLHAELAQAAPEDSSASSADAAPQEARDDAQQAAAEKREQLNEQLRNAQARLRDAQGDARDARQNLLAETNKFIREARRRENKLVGEKKSLNGIRTAKVSELGIKIGEGVAPRETDKIQAEIRSLDSQLLALTAGIAAAKDYRTGLEGVVADAEAPKAAAQKELEALKTELNRLDEQVAQNTWNVGEWITRWPVLNALYSGNVRIDQIWLPDLTINYNFSQVARFDRCTTCHRSISKTAPGTATDPLYPTIPTAQRDLTLELATPESKPTEGVTLKQAYGMELSAEGIINNADVTVHYVLPETPASRAGIESGDVIETIGDNPVYSPAEASERLMTLVDFGKPVVLGVRRGLDHPFTSHPRLDLYLTDMSPHPQKDMGCTICHDGQGSGTSFPWTSHTPDNAQQQNEWAQKHGWFDNHHWIFPMKPARFVESNCLKCHHEKTSLEPSERFPEPPAPKLVEGWSLVEEFGCFGCHEINGFDTPTATVGPDVRLAPNYAEVASQMLRFDSLSDEQRALAEKVRDDATNATARRELLAMLAKKPAASGETTADVAPDEADPRAAELHKLAAALKDVEIPGEYRKVGPSLRFLDAKVDYEWLYSWIRLPQDFRPDTRMPQFFLQYEHLSEPQDATELAESQTFEPIEIRAIAEYLLNASGEFEYETPPQNVTEQPSAERGKWVFESRGCLACHAHADFREIHSTQGPDLSRLGAKLNNDKGRQWLYAWVKQPHRYHVRTKMPNLFLDPIVEKDAQGQPTGVVTDPAADVVAYLLGVESDWRPENVPARGQWSDADKHALADLATLWLTSDAIPQARARKYLQEGIPAELEGKIKADERLLIGLTDENRTERQLEFVARRTIGKYGCFGCHDIPGFEDAKPIGTALADWGRKESSKLAFENIHKFLETHGLRPENPTHDARPEAGDVKHDVPAAEGGSEGAYTGSSSETGSTLVHGHLNPGDFDDDASYYVQSLNSHGRDGFLWQKLRYPRSYDYKTTRNKNFNERLRMPRFDFAHTVRKDGEDDQAFEARAQAEEAKAREAVMTFVLGLVHEPPATKYLYKPDARQQAIVDGRKVLDRFNCGGCHVLRMEQWEFDYAADAFEDASEFVDYPFLAPAFTDQEVARSTAKDSRGMMHASLAGHPVIDEETGGVTWVDQDRAPITPEELKEAEADEGEPIPVFYRFMLWKNALINGQPRLRGIDELLIPANRQAYGPASGKAYPAWGGDLARYLFPKVIARAKQTKPQVNGREAWGWLPPPLMDEGEKVQTDWLHGFLMDPYALRPATVLRMPNFRMSSEEAAKLVNYFAAASKAEFPYEYKPLQRPSYLAELRTEREQPLAEAMNIVTNGNYCVKCHSVADFHPSGDPVTFGPDLADVCHRLRPEYVRNWVANPARILPYTGMPVNIPYRPDDPHLGGIAQELYHGTSVEQLTGLVTLLMNFDAYTRGSASIAPLVEQAAAASAAASQEDPNAPPEASASQDSIESTQ